MKKITILLVLLLNVFLLIGREVTKIEAQFAAERLVALENSHPKQRTSPGSYTFTEIKPLLYNGQAIGYIVPLAPAGFMILPAITEEAPEKFVAFDSDFDTLQQHPLLIQMFDHIAETLQIINTQNTLAKAAGNVSVNAPNRAICESNQKTWQALLDPKQPIHAMSTVTDVAPMTTSHWNQGYPYNMYTPLDGGSPTYTGCSATSMAQLMYFWKHPAQGTGSHSYNWNGTTLSANFAHSYYWSAMTPIYNSGSSSAAMDAVARLMSDVGIAIDMNYGASGSGAVPNDNNALFEFFKYNAAVQTVHRSAYGDWSDWFNMFKGQVDNARPALLAMFKPGSGHAVVIDGYRTSPSNQVHVNMGWGESTADAYYDMSNIYGYGDANSDYAVIDIYPIGGGGGGANCVVTFMAGNGGTLSGNASQTVVSGGNCSQVSAVANTGYHFVNWTGTGGFTSTANPLTVTSVSQNMTITANFDNIPPLVNITSPPNISTAYGTISIEATASDDSTVTRVDFYIDNELKHTSFTAPYSMSWETYNMPNGGHIIKVKATDDGGLAGEDRSMVIVANIMFDLQATRLTEHSWLIQREYGQLNFSIVNTAAIAVAKYQIQRLTSDALLYQVVHEVASSELINNSIIYNDTFLDKTKHYTYKIVALDTAGKIIGISSEVTI